MILLSQAPPEKEYVRIWTCWPPRKQQHLGKNTPTFLCKFLMKIMLHTLGKKSIQVHKHTSSLIAY